MSRCVFSGSSTTEMPPTVAAPEVGSSSVASTRMVVDLPAPLGPMKPKICPAEKRNEIPFTARVRPYSLWRSTTSTSIAALLQDAEHGRPGAAHGGRGQPLVQERGGLHD